MDPRCYHMGGREKELRCCPGRVDLGDPVPPDLEIEEEHSTD